MTLWPSEEFDRRKEALIEATKAGNDAEFRMTVFNGMRDQLYQLMHDGATQASLTLNIGWWLSLLDEIYDRPTIRYSALIRDDALDRLNDAIDRIHEEANYLAAFGPGDLSERIGTTKRTPRQAASPALQRLMREKDQERSRKTAPKGDGEGK